MGVPDLSLPPTVTPQTLTARLTLIAQRIQRLNGQGILDQLFAGGDPGLVPTPNRVDLARGRFLRADGTWADPSGWVAFVPTLVAATGTWTGGAVTNAKYRVSGTTMTINFKILNTSVSATPLYIGIVIPDGYLSAGEMGTMVAMSDNGTPGTAWLVSSSAGGNQLSAFRNILGSVNWSTSVAATGMQVNFSFEIQRA